MKLFWRTHQFEIWCNGRQLPYEIFLTVQIISQFSLCQTVPLKSRFIKLGSWKRQQFSNVLKWRTCIFPKYSLSKCNIVFNIISLFIVFLQNQVDKHTYNNIQFSYAFISFSRNPWRTFAEAQGSEEPPLKNTALRKNVISLHQYIIYKTLTLYPVYN